MRAAARCAFALFGAIATYFIKAERLALPREVEDQNKDNGLDSQTSAKSPIEALKESSGSSNRLTAERLRELLSYDPDTGDFRWRVSVSNRSPVDSLAGTRNSVGHTIICAEGHYYTAGRLAWLWMTGAWPRQRVCFKNRDPSDTRWANLEDVSPSEANMRGQPSQNNTSGARGVYWQKQNRKWVAYITAWGRRITLGSHVLIEDAIADRQRAEEKYYGDSPLREKHYG